LVELTRSRDTAHRAVGFNLMHDHRVTRPQERKLRRYTGARPDATGLLDGLETYFQKRIRKARGPDYLKRAINRHNFIPTATGTTAGIHGDTELVRVLDLSGLREVFLRAKRRRKFRIFADSEVDRNFSRWLEMQLKRGPVEVRRFVGTVLAALDYDRRKYRFQPTWATPREDFEPAAGGGADRWLQVLGLKKSSFPRWLIVLKYSARDAGQLVRPTQLDAGASENHYPSPPQAPLETGGYTMDLRTRPAAGRLVREYIHQQVDHPIAHFVEIGEAVGARTGGLRVQRKNHHRLLVREHGTGVRDWMPTCI